MRNYNIGKFCPKCHAEIRKYTQTTGFGTDGLDGEVEYTESWLECICGFSNERLGGPGE